MGTAAESFGILTGGWSLAAKRCDSCKTAAAAALCRSSSAPLCLKCDTSTHNNDSKKQQLMSSHAPVWMCGMCEHAPASVMCKVDEVALCATCDADIHSANPLARRHERLPVEPFFDCEESVVKFSPFSFLATDDVAAGYHQKDEADGVSWMLPAINHNQNHHQQQQEEVLSSKVLDMENNEELKPGYQTYKLFLSSTNQFLNFEDHSSFEGMFYREQNHLSGGSDSVVPVQSKQSPIDHEALNNEMCFDIDFCRSKIPSSNYPSSQSLSHSVSSSSLDVGVVPDGNSMSDIPYPFGQNKNSSSAPISGTNATNQPTQLCGIDREARVLRYREKRKNRRFEKTIRYASRKAYAETRPRIKGRFAKRTVPQSDMDRFFHDSPTSDSFLTDAQYGVVPSF